MSEQPKPNRPTKYEKPVSLHPMSLEEALRKAMNAPPTEQQRKKNRKWRNKPPRRENAYRRNRRNTTGSRGRRLQRLRSERVERTFAHLCDNGGARRTWLRGLENVQKRYLSAKISPDMFSRPVDTTVRLSA